MLHLFLWMKRMKNLYSIPILHDGVLQSQTPEVLLCRLAEMSLTLHVHRLHAQSGCDIREIYSKSTSQVNKLYFISAFISVPDEEAGKPSNLAASSAL